MIGNVLIQLLGNKNVTPYKLAKSIGVNKQAIINYTKDINIPSLETAKKIADYFGVSIDYLVSGIIKNEKCSLYYYTTAETLLKILGAGPTVQIKYSNFNNSNDPNERTLYYRHFTESNEDSPLGGKKLRSEKEVKELMESNYKFLSFCKQPESNPYIIKRSTLPRMWAQYGTSQNKDGIDNKSYMDGACIELDFEKMISKAEKIKDESLNENGIKGLSFFDIAYKSDCEYYKLYHKDNIGIEDDIKFKYEDWSEENEYRALYTGKGDYLDIKGCIKRIYLGVDFRHDNVEKLCNIMASKRYPDITPDIFTRIVITKSDGLLQNYSNNGGSIWSDMFDVIKKDYPDYYEKLNPEYNGNSFDFYKKLEEERNRDKERFKLEVDHWKNKYTSSLEDNKKINEQLVSALKETILLQKNIESISTELGETKNVLAVGVSAVVDVLTRRTGS